MSNIKFSNALNCIPQNCPPIWFMRQAGRYHQHYQKLKESYTFDQLCKTPELAAETAMGPILDFDFDAAILFSDILYPLEALGMDLKYNPGPIISTTLLDIDLNSLKNTEEALQFMMFQKRAMQATRENLPKDKSLIGFIGGPWTLFSYAIGNDHKGHLTTAKTNLELFHSFSHHLIPLLKENIRIQLEGGAEVVMIFDTAAGELSSQLFEQVMAPKITELTSSFPRKTAYYGKGVCQKHYDTLNKQDLAGFGFDHRWNLVDIAKRPKNLFFQGNFDQTLFFTSPDNFKSVLMNYLSPIKELSPEERAGWICGLGHGVLPKTPEENVRTFVNTIREVFHEQSL